MKFFKFSILVFFIFAVFCGVVPLNKVNAQVFTSVCGYDESTSSDINCTYEINIEDDDNILPTSSLINANFIFLSSTGSLVGIPSVVEINNFDSSYGAYCSGGTVYCYHTTGQYPTTGAYIGTHGLNVYFKWDTSYGVYEYNKDIPYIVGSDNGDTSRHQYVSVSANPVNTTGNTTITFTPYHAHDCILHDYNYTTRTPGGIVSGVTYSGGTYSYTTSINSTKGYYISCSAGIVYGPSQNRFVRLPNFIKNITNLFIPKSVFAEELGLFNSIIINKVPVPQPTAILILKPEPYKDLVKANNTEQIGTSYFKTEIHNLPTNATCDLKNITNNSLVDNSINSNGIFYSYAKDLEDDVNNFQVICTKNSSVIAESNTEVVEGQAGTLTSSNPSCVVPAGGSTCSVPLTWNTTSPMYGLSTEIKNIYNNQTIATGNTGSQNVTIHYSNGAALLKAFNEVDGEINETTEPNELGNITIDTQCATGSTWNGTICLANVTTPDLTASLPPENSALVNSPVNFTSLISNIGNGSTGKSFYNKFQVATAINGGGTISDLTSTPSPMPTIIADGSATATSASYTFTTTGNRSVRACADSTGVVTESNEGNNCSGWTNVTVTGVSVRDLTASAPTETQATIGTPISFHSTILNTGNTSTSGTNLYNSFQFATGQNGFGATTPLVRSTPGPMPALHGGESAVATSLAQTFAGPARTISVRACADMDVNMDQLISESNNNNNCSSWTNVNITSGAQPDLVASITTPTLATRGVATTFFSTITNQGDASTGNSFYNLFQTSTEANGGGIVSDYRTTLAMPTLGIGAHATAQKSITFTTSGTYYMRACADKSSASDTLGTISESNDLNNCSAWINLRVQDSSLPDLTASEPTPTSATVNEAINFTSVISNIGALTTGTSFYNSFQVANSSSGLGIITNLTSTPSPMPAIIAGGSATATSYTHAFTSEGIYSVRACADTSTLRAITESNEGNNCSRWVDIKVTASMNLIDLIASAPTENSATIGNPINFTSTITNIGVSSTIGSFYNSFQVATGADGAGTITPLSSTPSPMPALYGGDSAIATSRSYTFSSAGTYSVRACADNNTLMVGTIPETDEGHNCSGWTNVSVVPFSGTITASNCSIALNASSCNSTIAWNTINPLVGVTSAVTTPTNITVATGNSGTTTYSMTPPGYRTFYLYHNGVELNNATANAVCISGTSWNGAKCVTSGDVNGGWSWNCGPCSVTCGGGTQTCTGTCNNPPPQGNGSQCLGSGTMTQICNTQSCGGGEVSIIDYFTATPAKVLKGRSSTLSWGATHASSCIGTGFDTGGATSGNVLVRPTSTTVYTLTCTNGSSSPSSDATVQVIVPVIIEN